MVLEKVASIVAAAALLLNGSMQTALPDKDLEGTLFVINRTHSVSAYFEPLNRRVNGTGLAQTMRPDAADAMDQMIAAAKAEGLTLSVVSGYRSYSKQAAIYARKVKNTGSERKADELVARAGTSEHQLGLAMDLGTKNNTSLTENFAKTQEGKWVYDHAHEYGFIIRYLKGYEEITGYNYEPWHVRYVGRDLAGRIRDSGLPLESFMSDYKMEMYDYLVFTATND